MLPINKLLKHRQKLKVEISGTKGNFCTAKFFIGSKVHQLVVCMSTGNLKLSLTKYLSIRDSCQNI